MAKKSDSVQTDLASRRRQLIQELQDERDVVKDDLDRKTAEKKQFPHTFPALGEEPPGIGGDYEKWINYIPRDAAGKPLPNPNEDRRRTYAALSAVVGNLQSQYDAVQQAMRSIEADGD